MFKWSKTTALTLLAAIVLLALPIGISCAPKATPTPAAVATPAPAAPPTSVEKPVTPAPITPPSAVAKPATPATTPAPPPAPAKPIELKFSEYNSAQVSIVKNACTRWAKEVEARTNGRVKVTMYYSAALGKANDQYDIVSKGIAEVAHVMPTYTAGRFPLTNISEIPFYGDTTKAIKSWNDLFDQNLHREYPEVKKMFAWGPPHDIGTKKPVKTLEEFKGLKVRTTGGYVTKWLEVLGATPVAMPIVDVYTSIERGVIDGYTLTYNAWPSYKLEEVCKNVIVARISLPSQFVAMNIDTWNSLPPDIQKIIEGVNADAIQWAIDSYIADDVNAKEVMLKAGVNFYYLPPAEKARWVAKGKPLMDEWEKEMNAKGLPGTKVRADFEAILKKNGVEY